MAFVKLSLLHPGSTCQLKRAAHRARHFEKTVDTFKLEFTCTRRSTPVAVQPQVIGTLGFQLPKDTVVLKILPHLPMATTQKNAVELARRPASIY